MSRYRLEGSRANPKDTEASELPDPTRQLLRSPQREENHVRTSQPDRHN